MIKIWVLIFYAGYGGYSIPIDMPSKEICVAAAQSFDNQTGNQWGYCLNKETGEIIISK